MALLNRFLLCLAAGPEGGEGEICRTTAGPRYLLKSIRIYGAKMAKSGV